MRFPFTQQHLADPLGMSLVHTSRTLEGLSGRKRFRWNGGIFKLLDEDNLAALAGYGASSAVLRPLI